MMMTILSNLLFAAAFAVALATIIATVAPRYHRIVSLLRYGVQYRTVQLPALRPRAAGRATPLVTAVPARLRVAA